MMAVGHGSIGTAFPFRTYISPALMQTAIAQRDKQTYIALYTHIGYQQMHVFQWFLNVLADQSPEHVTAIHLDLYCICLRHMHCCQNQTDPMNAFDSKCIHDMSP